MATIYANHAFNILDIDLNRLFANRTGWEFLDNENLRHRGEVYRDGYLTEWSSGGNDFGSLFRGANLTVTAAGNITGGTIQSYSEYLWTGARFYELWGIEGISLDAGRVFSAMRSRTQTDDDALIARAFRGADRLALSPDHDVANGFAGNDTLAGGGGGDVLGGGTGHDRLLGQAGNDHLFLDPGNDFLSGGPGRDTVHLSGGRDVTVRLAVTGRQNTGYGQDTIRGVEDASTGSGDDSLTGNGGANRLTGNRGDDLLTGKGGHDLLRGGGGADRLLGGAGSDTLTGDSGADRFIFRDIDEIGRSARHSDVITDFQHGRDLIDLRGIDASTLLSGNNAFLWLDDDPIGTSARGEVQWEHLNRPGRAHDVTLIRIDIDADRAAEAEIRLSGLVDLSAGDFLF